MRAVGRIHFFHHPCVITDLLYRLHSFWMGTWSATEMANQIRQELQRLRLNQTWLTQSRLERSPRLSLSAQSIFFLLIKHHLQQFRGRERELYKGTSRFGRFVRGAEGSVPSPTTFHARTAGTRLSSHSFVHPNLIPQDDRNTRPIYQCQRLNDQSIRIYFPHFSSSFHATSLKVTQHTLIGDGRRIIA